MSPERKVLPPRDPARPGPLPESSGSGRRRLAAARVPISQQSLRGFGQTGYVLFVTKIFLRRCDIPTVATAASRLCENRLGGRRRHCLGKVEMRHLLLAGTMLVAALVVTFATASVLQGVAVAQDNSVQGEQC